MLFPVFRCNQPTAVERLLYYPTFFWLLIKPTQYQSLYGIETAIYSFLLTMKANRFMPLLLLLLTLLAGTVAGVAGPGKGPGRGEVQSYYQQNVLPVLRQQRQKLEPQLASADKAQLAIYRTQLQELKQRGKALRQSIRPAGTAPGTRPALTETQKQQLQQLHSESRAILLNVAQMAQKYNTNISKLAQEVQPQKEKWTTDIKALVEKNQTPEQQEKLGRWAGKRHRRSGPANRFFKPALFLLMDPNAPAAAERDLGRTSLYPNPVVATSQLEYEVKKAGPVTVELLDGRGNVVRTVAQQPKQEKGQHMLSVPLADLPAGTYFYKITTRAGAETRRFVKE